MMEGWEKASELRAFEQGLEKLMDSVKQKAEDHFPKPPVPWSKLPEDQRRQVLVDASAWLNISSMRSERLQYNMLCTQNYTNVYRKQAWKHLASNSATWQVEE